MVVVVEVWWDGDAGLVVGRVKTDMTKNTVPRGKFGGLLLRPKLCG